MVFNQRGSWKAVLFLLHLTAIFFDSENSDFITHSENLHFQNFSKSQTYF